MSAEEDDSSEGDEYPTVVIDLGSGYTKCGYAGDEYPKSIFPTVVGERKYHMCMIGMTQRAHYAGREAVNKRGLLHLENPIKHGLVVDWDQIENVLQYVFYGELRVAPEDLHTLITDAPGNPRSNREKFVEMFFEVINSLSFYMGMTSTLALYASGRTTGIVLDSGHGITSAVPIYEGMPLSHQIRRLEMGGHELTEYIIRQLRYRGHTFESSAEKEVIRRLKEKLCFCSLDYEQDEEKYNKNNKIYSEKDGDLTETYILPDGTSIQVGAERYQVPEVMFNPAIIGVEAPGVDGLVFDSINHCAMDMRRVMYKNIVLAGGNTQFKNFKPRLQAEVSRLRDRAAQHVEGHAGAEVEVIVEDDRSILAWLGGSVLASLDSFKELWVTKEEYEDEGNRIIERFAH